MPPRPNMVLPALYGGIIISIISAVPGLNLLNCLCCAGILLGGFFAVFFYKKDLTPGMQPLSSSDGLKLGALAGVFGAIGSLLLEKLVMMLMGGSDVEMMKGMIESFGLADALPPGTMEQIESQMSSPVGFVQIIAAFIINPLFGLLGGLIGYSILKGKAAPPAPPVQPSAQPPVQQA